jgi:hypothetical protein
MKTLTDIIEKIFPVVNVTSVKNTLSGGAVYRFSKPDNTQGKHIVILSLPISNNEDPVTQTSVVIINCFAENFPNGMSDDISINSIMDAVISVLEAYTSGTQTYFEFVIESQSLFKDVDDELMSYGSLRLKCTIES